MCRDEIQLVSYPVGSEGFPCKGGWYFSMDYVTVVMRHSIFAEANVRCQGHGSDASVSRLQPGEQGELGEGGWTNS